MRFATAACNFSTSEQTKVLRSRHVLYILTFKCAFRHSGVQFLTGLLFDWPDTRIIEKTQHFATSLTFGADVSSFFWLSDSCIFCRLTWWLYCWAMHLLFNCPYCRKFLFKLPSIIYGHWNLLIVYVLIHLKHGPPGIFPQWLGNFKMSRWRKRLKILCIRGNWNLQFFKISALSLSLSLDRLKTSVVMYVHHVDNLHINIEIAQRRWCEWCRACFLSMSWWLDTVRRVR